MTPSQFIEGLRLRGATLERDGDRLIFVGLSEIATPKVQDFIRRHRVALLDELDPFRLCSGCQGALRWYWTRIDDWVCGKCDPPMDLPADEVRWEGASERFSPVHQAGAGQPITHTED
jgi:hypothetical protein